MVPPPWSLPLPAVLAAVVVLAGACAAIAAEPPAAAAIAPVAGRYVIDVRSAGEWANGHVAGAVHVPHDRIAERIRSLVPDRDAPIALYCASGGRSNLARDILRALRYTDVENRGGIGAARARVAAGRDCGPPSAC